MKNVQYSRMETRLKKALKAGRAGTLAAVRTMQHLPREGNR